jgi:hypothetical protein
MLSAGFDTHAEEALPVTTIVEVPLDERHVRFGDTAEKVHDDQQARNFKIKVNEFLNQYFAQDVVCIARPSPQNTLSTASVISGDRGFHEPRPL